MEKRKACGLHCIKMKDISVTIGDTRILNNINLHIHCGELTTIIGKNGSGKSTLIKAILGELPCEGIIELRSPGDKKTGNLRIGYVPQFLNIPKNTPTSVYDLCASFASHYPVFLGQKVKLRKNIIEKLEVFQASELIDKAVCDLSGGELQRVLLSIAISPIPNLLILDEPVSGIDQNGLDLFYQQLDMLKKEYDLAILLVSHDLDYVKKYSDNVILLEGTIIESGSPEEVFESKAFLNTFGNMGRVK